jgi:hypothetical protein
MKPLDRDLSDHWPGRQLSTVVPAEFKGVAGRRRVHGADR